MIKKVLVAGNCTIDLIFQSDALESREKGDRWSLAHGGKYLVDRFLLSYGGGGANAAVSLARQQIETWLFCQTGDDFFTPLLRENFRHNQVKTELISQITGPNAVSAVIIDKTGDKTIFNFRAETDRLHFSPAVKNKIRKVDGVALYSLAHWPKKEKLEFLDFSHQAGKVIFLSLHGTEYVKGLHYLKDYFRYATIIHLNVHEAADMIGKKVTNINFYQDNFARILHIPLVLVSHDVNGSYAYTEDQIYYQTIVGPRRAVDSTGAGDAFSSGFFGTYLKTGDIKKSLHFGAANAGSVIQHFGAQNILLTTR